MITSVQVSSKRKSGNQNKVEIALPSKDSGSITVICGRNHSGKTYTVRRIHRSIWQRNEAIEEKPDEPYLRHGVGTIYVEYAPNTGQINSILVARVENITELLKSVSIILENNNKSRHHLQKSDNYFRIQMKEALELLVCDCVADILPRVDGTKFDIDSWKKPENINYRRELLNKFSYNSLYLTPRNNSVIAFFEKITQGKVYFGINLRDMSSELGKTPEFELRLVFDNNEIIALGGWSEGQRVLFSLLTLVAYLNPEILIFDEIENHLHPEYISALLEFIKPRVKQTIITTHHPHIIFSRYVDIVNYLEFEKSSDDLPEIIEGKKNDQLKSMKLSSRLLTRNYNKLISTYKLFDNYDNQLLRLSSSNIADLNDALIDIFTSLFIYEVIEPQKLKTPDIQSQKLYEIFEQKIIEKDISVLEYGAGKGRLLIDVSKLLKTHQKTRVTWNLFEPFEECGQKLVENLANHPYIENISIYRERPEDQFDFVVIANVLHELSPKSIADILVYSAGALKNDGSIIIVELYPLLKPEKYAVPLRSTEWTSLARKIGFQAVSRGINFRNASHEAYFTQLTVPQNGLNADPDAVEKVIKEFWNNTILLDRVSEYAGHLRLADSEDIPRSLGLLCSIASIAAVNNELWTN